MKVVSSGNAGTFPPEVYRAANSGLIAASFTLQAGWTVFIIGATERIMRD
jgi:hypothetical protein